MFKNLFVEDVEIFHGNEMSDFAFVNILLKGKLIMHVFKFEDPWVYNNVGKLSKQNDCRV